MKRRTRAKKTRKPGSCQKCGLYRRSLHRDHVIPLWKGGPDEESNCQYLCANCHQDKTLDEHQSPEYRALVRARYTPEVRQRLSQRLKGRQVSDETRKRLSLAQTGVKRPDISTRQKAHWADPEWRARTMASMAKRVQPKRGSAVTQKIVEAVCAAEAPLTMSEISAKAGVKFHSVHTMMCGIVREGLVRRVARGLYARPDYVAQQELALG